MRQEQLDLVYGSRLLYESVLVFLVVMIKFNTSVLRTETGRVGVNVLQRLEVVKVRVSH